MGKATAVLHRDVVRSACVYVSSRCGGQRMEREQICLIATYRHSCNVPLKQLLFTVQLGAQAHFRRSHAQGTLLVPSL